MNIIKVKASSEYEVIIERGALERAGELASAVLAPCCVCIVTDDTVDALYSKTLENSLTSAGLRELAVRIFPIPEHILFFLFV